MTRKGDIESTKNLYKTTNTQYRPIQILPCLRFVYLITIFPYSTFISYQNLSLYLSFVFRFPCSLILDNILSLKISKGKSLVYVCLSTSTSIEFTTHTTTKDICKCLLSVFCSVPTDQIRFFLCVFLIVFSYNKDKERLLKYSGRREK